MSHDASKPDPAAVRRARDRAADGYDDADVLAGRVLEQLVERLDLIALDPALVVDIGCATGQATAALARRFRRARIVGVDVSPAMAATAAGRSRWRRRFDTLCADPARLPFADGSVDLVFSSLLLPLCPDPEAVFAEFARVLSPRGALSFSALGPDTLAELRASWDGVDAHTHVHGFFDMHDLGDALMRHGLADPVLDVEHWTLTYAAVGDLYTDLKGVGATNATLGRNRGLTGRGRFRAAAGHYEAQRRDGRLPASVEVVYGHAFGSDKSGRGRAPGGVVEVPVARIGRRR